ncbi:hypothetical protein [Fimbriiglobus ruber]|uniref:hypothetical protein n=1 Tax=Fimbriiglobus ruber TaxID=1908690 RepID=UPI00117B8C9B|nr:hypothetical protein [Fimbriiglobus ruber]
MVIENILVGYFQGQEEPSITFVQPPPASVATPSPPGGWTRVFDSLKRGDCQQVLQFNDFVVIQIDTDVQEEPGFDVPRREGGSELSLPDRVARVIARLKRDVEPEFCTAHEHRILFAIAVDSIECWLLPLLYVNNKAQKTTGCLDAANDTLRKKKMDGLSSAEGTKFPRAYERASREYTKQKSLTKHRSRNPSLELFVKQLDDLQGRLNASQNAAPQEPEDVSRTDENSATEPPGQ